MKYITILTIALLLLVSSCGSSRTDNFESFVAEDPKPYNDQILAVKNNEEPWVSTPLLIVNYFFGPQYHTEGHAGFAFEQTKITQNKIKVMVTQEGLLDDSVYGEKRVIEFVFSNDQWTIATIKVGYKCQSNRGHQHYSGEVCS